MPRLPQAVASNESPISIACDALIVGAFSGDDGPEVVDGKADLNSHLDGYLKELSATGFRARLGEVLIVPTFRKIAPRAIAVTGLGPRASSDRSTLCSAAASAAKKLSETSELASMLHLALEDTFEGQRAVAEGFGLGCYRFLTYKSDPRPPKIQRIVHLEGDGDGLELGEIATNATWIARDLINEPASVLTPEVMARRAKDLADVNDLECTVIEHDELQARGFGGLIATAAGSGNAPCLIRLRYMPESPTEKIALVGKGVTFDSGGLSIKPAASMELMKTDMSGGAVAIAVMTGLKRLGVRAEVEALIPAVENMTGSSAMRPGDVITHYGGKTTEVTNTDAEGRLILADTLALASEGSPAAIIDIATLTGSMTVALGKKASGLFSTNDDLRSELLAAAEATGERTWPFPLYEDYLSELDSDVADHKNAGIRWGGAIIAAMYLKQFVGSGIPWAHLDIAGTGRSERDYLEIARGGTGIPVRTLLEWLRVRST